MSIFKKIFNKDKKESLDKGLEKSKTNFFDKVSKALVGKSRVDESVLDDLEEILIASDVGVNTTVKIIERIEARVAKDKYTSTSELDTILREEIAALLSENEGDVVLGYELPTDIKPPYILMVVGVNGVGKTTTIGKLSAQYKALGKKVVLGAADTFRAAAVEQLIQWGKRVDVPVISKGMNVHPATVAFDTVEYAIREQADVVIIDTAGRLHTKVNLMNELTKIKKVIQKHVPDAPHEIMLVLDGSTGQNAFIQAQEFTKATEINSLAITKLDGTAKGGVVIGISDQFQIPVKYIGVGEKVEDLQVFDKIAFVESFFTLQQ
ncbi:MAG: signal recognition particle-docking protein FtsY [Bernardetiaceae bacterium]|nr:signal recognition particle-docking protein FtsY [Bernardetiaceae bacterium]